MTGKRGTNEQAGNRRKPRTCPKFREALDSLAVHSNTNALFERSYSIAELLRDTNISRPLSFMETRRRSQIMVVHSGIEKGPDGLEPITMIGGYITGGAITIRG